MNIIDFQKSNGLVPTIIQDYKTGDVYMLGYMNEESFAKTKETGFVHFWSRRRKKIWMKGEESGNKLSVKEILEDCDNDTLLIKAELLGTACCHTGALTCFFQKV